MSWSSTASTSSRPSCRLILTVLVLGLVSPGGASAGRSGAAQTAKIARAVSGDVRMTALPRHASKRCLLTRACRRSPIAWQGEGRGPLMVRLWGMRRLRHILLDALTLLSLLLCLASVGL